MTGFWWLTWCIKQFFSPSKCHKDQSEYIVEGEESLSNKNLQRNHQAGRKIFTHLAKIVFTDQQDYLIFNFVLPEPHNLLSTDFFAIGNDSGKILHAFENAGPAESWKPLVWKKYGLHQVYKSLFHCESYVVKKSGKYSKLLHMLPWKPRDQSSCILQSYQLVGLITLLLNLWNINSTQKNANLFFDSNAWSFQTGMWLQERSSAFAALKMRWPWVSQPFRSIWN